jgi:predicted transcriptional regulator
VTQDGRYAEALLERLDDIEQLDTVATDEALQILQTLTPRSRPKAAQALSREFARADVNIDQDLLVERLKGTGLLLELEPMSAEALSSRVGRRPREVLATLGPLIHAGLIVRGHHLPCPVCNFKQVLDLVDLDETVRCRACRATFVLPVTEANGSREPALTYRLDGLMARAMDQDVLPVLLALRALKRLFSDRLVFSWPGVEFTRSGAGVDVDVLLYNQDAVYCCEVKLNAESLHRAQLDKQLALCDALGGRPALAALNGEFATDLQAEVLHRSGLVLTRTQLLDH